MILSRKLRFWYWSLCVNLGINFRTKLDRRNCASFRWLRFRFVNFSFAKGLKGETVSEWKGDNKSGSVNSVNQCLTLRKFLGIFLALHSLNIYFQSIKYSSIRRIKQLYLSHTKSFIKLPKNGVKKPSYCLTGWDKFQIKLESRLIKVNLRNMECISFIRNG